LWQRPRRCALPGVDEQTRANDRAEAFGTSRVALRNRSVAVCGKRSTHRQANFGTGSWQLVVDPCCERGEASGVEYFGCRKRQTYKRNSRSTRTTNENCERGWHCGCDTDSARTGEESIAGSGGGI